MVFHKFCAKSTESANQHDAGVVWLNRNATKNVQISLFAYFLGINSLYFKISDLGGIFRTLHILFHKKCEQSGAEP
jgi:hypothetical protein